MTWLRQDDHATSDPRILAICTSRDDHHRSLGMLWRLQEACAAHLTDGFLPRFQVTEVLSAKWLRLFTAPPDGGAPLLHKRHKDESSLPDCGCFRTDTWPDGAAFAICGYLKHNPAREESDVARAKRAELADAELRASVRARDEDRCRYCGVLVNWHDHRSGRGGVLDHVDPRIAAGIANLVVSCRACNGRKGNRTPAAAAMTLRPEPHDPRATKRNTRRTDPGSRPARDDYGRARDGTGQRPRSPGQVGPSTVRRDPADPDPYLRDAITGAAPDNFAGLPDTTDDQHTPPPDDWEEST